MRRPQAFAALNGELLQQLGDVSPDPVVRSAVALLPGLPVSGVAARLFVSERQLQRRFGEAIGYGPKTLQRILRFQRAIAGLRGSFGLAGAAVLAGYADQAHFSRESRRLAGLSPRALALWLG